MRRGDRRILNLFIPVLTARGSVALGELVAGHLVVVAGLAVYCRNLFDHVRTPLLFNRAIGIMLTVLNQRIVVNVLR